MMRLSAFLKGALWALGAASGGLLAVLGLWLNLPAVAVTITRLKADEVLIVINTAIFGGLLIGLIGGFAATIYPIIFKAIAGSPGEGEET